MAIERLEGLEDSLTAWVTNQKAIIMAECADPNGPYANYDPLDRPDRAEAAPGCRIKHNDHILVDGSAVRVVCPGPYRGYIFTMEWASEGQAGLGQRNATAVTDRAPADPEEEALPIFESPSEPPPGP